MSRAPEARAEMRLRRGWLGLCLLALGLAFPASVFADAPSADDKPSETTAEDTLHTVTMSGADVDGDTLTFSTVANPAHGTLSNFGTPASCSGTPSACTETVDYTPDANYNGPDSFTYK